MWGEHPSLRQRVFVAADGGAHDGIVDQGSVHSSSLRADNRAPPMGGAGGNAASAQKWIDECAASDECSVAPAEKAAGHGSSHPTVSP